MKQRRIFLKVIAIFLFLQQLYCLDSNNINSSISFNSMSQKINSNLNEHHNNSLSNKLINSFNKEVYYKEIMFKQINIKIYKELKSLIYVLKNLILKRNSGYSNVKENNSDFKNSKSEYKVKEEEFVAQITRLNENNKVNNQYNTQCYSNTKTCIAIKSESNDNQYNNIYKIYQTDNNIINYKFLEVRKLFSKELFSSHNSNITNEINNHKILNDLIKSLFSETILLVVTKSEIILSISSELITNLINNISTGNGNDKRNDENLEEKKSNAFSLSNSNFNDSYISLFTYKIKDIEIILSSLYYFEDDLNLVVITNSYELIEIKVEFNFSKNVLISISNIIDEIINSISSSGNDNSKRNAITNLNEELLYGLITFTVPYKKKILLDFDNDNSSSSENYITNLEQYKLHGNKYYIISFSKGNVLVLTKDLEIRTSFEYSERVNKIYIFNGMLSVINTNNIFFTNMLGGNSILLTCYSSSNIVNAYFDNTLNFLFLINDLGLLTVFNTKLSMAKINTNECKGKYILN